MQDASRWDDHHPELEQWEPYDRSGPSRRRVTMLRVVVIVAITALVLPGALSTWSLADSTAQRACAIASQAIIGTAHGSVARFEVFGPGVVSWECYAVTATGDEWVISLGAIPGLPASVGRQLAVTG